MKLTDPAALPLRDIHLPPPPSWWPPAPGWWLLGALLLCSLLLATWLWRRWRLHAPLRAARRELHRLREAAASGADAAAIAARLSMLLRRIALLRHPERRVACLADGAWLRFLDEGMEGRPFTTGVGRALLEAPYRPRTDVDLDGLLDLAGMWIENHYKSKNNILNIKPFMPSAQRREGPAR